ncbi:MAG: hypothetical protein OXE53_07255 [Deltaproteobacteria bacterium]|nr:hypothetical protein [Deltaproteobacteria bacterium]
MLATNHRKPRRFYSARLPWRHRRRWLAPYVGGTNVLCVYHGDDGSWWSDGSAVFRGTVPTYLRRAYLHAGMPAETVVERLQPFHPPSEAHPLIRARLDEPVATYRINFDAGSHGSIPVDVFATGDAACPEIHVDARYVAHALDRFEDCSFWNLDNAGIAVRDRLGYQIVGLIPRRQVPPADAHRTGGTL